MQITTIITVNLSPPLILMEKTDINAVLRYNIPTKFRTIMTLIQGAVSKKCLRFFSGFRGELTCTKTQQSEDKTGEHKSVKYFARINRWCQLFLFSSIHFTSSLFASTFLFDSASATDRVRRPPGTSGHKKIHTASPLTSYKAI